jgi:hypothetical protein
MEDETMTIPWRHDVDRVLAEAKGMDKPILFDFTAALM